MHLCSSAQLPHKLSSGIHNGASQGCSYNVPATLNRIHGDNRPECRGTLALRTTQATTAVGATHVAPPGSGGTHLNPEHGESPAVSGHRHLGQSNYSELRYQDHPSEAEQFGV